MKSSSVEIRIHFEGKAMTATDARQRYGFPLVREHIKGCDPDESLFTEGAYKKSK